MHITCNIEGRPGPAALFVAEVKIEKSPNITKEWWGLWIGWWVLPMKLWRRWLYCWDMGQDGEWFTWQLSLLGFEVTWQRRRRG